MTETTARILLIGATGYIGDTVLDHLINSKEPSIKPLTIDVLVRDNKATEILHNAYGTASGPSCGLVSQTFPSSPTRPQTTT